MSNNELNQDPIHNFSKAFSICHWNQHVNCISSHWFICKGVPPSHVEYCFSETYLNSEKSYNSHNSDTEYKPLAQQPA